MIVLFGYDLLIIYSRVDFFFSQAKLVNDRNSKNLLANDDGLADGIMFNAIFNMILNFPVLISGLMIIIFKLRTVWKKMELHTT
jgi:hypothetical protein